MTEPVESGPDARRFHVLATSEHRVALRRAGIAGWWSRPGTWGRFVASFVLLALGAVLYDVQQPAGSVVAVLVPAAFLGLARLRFGRGMDRALERGWGDGTEHATVFDDAGFASRGPLGAVEYRLAALREVRRRGDVVEVRLRPRGTVLVVADLFPVEEERRLNEALTCA